MQRSGHANSTKPIRLRFIWRMLEVQEIIKLKLAMLARDAGDAADLFWRTIAPCVSPLCGLVGADQTAETRSGASSTQQGATQPPGYRFTPLKTLFATRNSKKRGYR